MSENKFDSLRIDCWNQALHAYGTAYIFEERISKYKNRLNLIKFAGLGVPLFIGLVVIAYGSDFYYLKIMLIIASILIILQLICSLWLIIANWEEKHSHAIKSTFSNYELAKKYKKLAKDPPSNFDDFKFKYDTIEARSKELDRQDYQQAISGKEERKGMRKALRKYQRECSACGKVPTSMEPTNCNVCGNF